MKLPNQSSNVQRLSGVAEASHQGASPSQFSANPLYIEPDYPLYVLSSLNSCLVSFGGGSWKRHVNACLQAAGFHGVD
ncbi:MAG: hypothetical protein KME20_08985 [Kaiparowitsia implicata GSE-PSE-MK54-09C]|jgi:hypothetical protein|nr:hypothetical protein [Kaiparowitsia implicata GSE-PSE-MK54-09C]